MYIGKISLSLGLARYAKKVGGFENLATMIDVKDPRVPHDIKKDFLQLRDDLFASFFPMLDDTISNCIDSQEEPEISWEEFMKQIRDL